MWQKLNGSRLQPTAESIERMRRFLILAVVALSGGSLMADDHGVTLTVIVTNISEAKGDLLIGIYDNDKAFTKKPLPCSPKIDLTSEDVVTAEIMGLSPGKYAIAVIQDLNENGKLDKTPFGPPKEPLAFSVVNDIPKGKPAFEACSFEVGGEDLKMTIALVVK